MSTDTTTSTGKFVWHEHVSQRTDEAKRFYTDLFGWELEPFAGGGEMQYDMIKSGGAMHGGFASPQGDIPPHWLSHVLVDDVDETVRRAEAAGGTVRFGPTEFPEVGRFAIVADAQGAAFSLYAAAGEAMPSNGIFLWDELHTSDIADAKSFYREILGWTATDRDMGGGTTYTIFERSGGDQVGGCFGLSDGEPVSNWFVYIGTEDVDASVERAKELGATIVHEPTDIPEIGRFAVVQDPVGAFFGLFKPTQM